MGMYRDSQLGLCLDISGPDGNIFRVLAVGDDLARQLDIEEDWKEATKAARLMGCGYVTFLHLFREYFPIVTLVNAEQYFDEDTEDDEA